MKKECHLESFKEYLENKNSHQPLFIQAVEEIAADLIPFRNNPDEYCKQKLMERIVEPDRIILF